MTQAKLELNLDVKTFTKRTQEAKTSLEALGKVDVGREFGRRFKKAIRDDVKSSINELKTHQDVLKRQLLDMSKASKDVWDTKKISDTVKQLEKVSAELKVQKRLSQSMGMGGGGGAIQGGAGGGRVGGGMPMQAARTLAMLGISVGVMASLTRSAGLSRGRLGVTGIAGGSASDSSSLGYTFSERLQSGQMFGRSAGRDLSSGQIDRRIDTGEMLQRGFGISMEESSRAMGAARRAGVKNDRGFVSESVGVAMNAGLSGSAIPEYLAAMSGYLESMSKGVDVDEKSLQGFAGHMARLPFFRTNPERIFDMIRGIGGVLQKNDKVSNLISYESISNAAGTEVSPAAIELRKSMGLFGNVDTGDMEQFRNVKGYKDLITAMGVSGKDLTNSIINNVIDKAPDNAAYQAVALQKIFDLEGGTTKNLLNEITRQTTNPDGSRNGKRVDLAGTAVGKAIEAQIKKQAEGKMDKDGAPLKILKSLDTVANTMSEFVTGGVGKLVDGMDEFSKATGLFHSDIEKIGILVAAGVAGRGLMGGGAGGFGGKSGVGPGVAIGAGGLIGGALSAVAAAAIGYEIGKGINKALDEWTDGSFSRTLQSMFDWVGNAFMPDKHEQYQKQVEPYMQDWIKEKGSAINIDEGRRLGTARKNLKKWRHPGSFFSGEEQDISAKDVFEMKRLMDSGEDYDQLVHDPEGYWSRQDLTEGGEVHRAGGGRIGRSDAAKKISSHFGGGVTLDWMMAKAKKAFGKETASERFTKQFKKRKGKKGYASGGPVGSDTVAGWLTPNEYVVNAASAQKNLGALVYANSGGLIAPVTSSSDIGGTMMPPINFASLESALGQTTAALYHLASQLVQSGGSNVTLRNHPRGQSVAWG